MSVNYYIPISELAELARHIAGSPWFSATDEQKIMARLLLKIAAGEHPAMVANETYISAIPGSASHLPENTAKNTAQAIPGGAAPPANPNNASPDPLPPCPSALFRELFPRWEALIADGKKTAQEIIVFLNSKYALSDQQIKQLKGIVKDRDPFCNEEIPQ